MNAGRPDDAEVALGDVGAGEADLRRGEAVLERVRHLAGGAGVHTDSFGRPRLAEDAQRAEHLRRVLGLERQPHVRREAGARERMLQRARLLRDVRHVDHVQRCAVLASERLGVASCDEQAPVVDAHPLVLPRSLPAGPLHGDEPIAVPAGGPTM